eukprot:8516257-Alexandrium_andersonii.AAC.1
MPGYISKQHARWLKLTRGLHSTWMRLRPQKAPQAETSLSRAWDRRKAGGDPEVSALKPWTRTLHPAGLAGTAASSMCDASSPLFRAVPG